MFSASQYFQSFVQKLTTVYDADEARAMANAITTDLLLIKYQQLTIIDKTLTEADVTWFNAILERLLKHEPLQYILGYTWFCGMKFEVNEHVLIPRPETEELVDLVVDHCRTRQLLNPVIIDLGTGSGCIPVAIKKKLPSATVYGADIMDGALEVARKNAWLNKVDVPFFKDDILHPAVLSQHAPYDLIISNPPYIAEEEEGEMELQVKSYEPRVALFSPGDPLRFYRAIRDIAGNYLTTGGSVWLEVNPLFAEETKALFDTETIHNGRIINDMSGKKRFVVVGP